MAFLARLINSAAAAFGIKPGGEAESGFDDEHLAATALLVHVARADGVLAPAETERLARLVETRYADSPDEARALIARATRFDDETRDLSSLVEVIGIETDAEDRRRLLAMAWSVAGADGDLHEFEEALVWRLGKLLGLDEAAIAQARAGLPPEEATAAGA